MAMEKRAWVDWEPILKQATQVNESEFPQRTTIVGGQLELTDDKTVLGRLAHARAYNTRYVFTEIDPDNPNFAVTTIIFLKPNSYTRDHGFELGSVFPTGMKLYRTRENNNSIYIEHQELIHFNSSSRYSLEHPRTTNTKPILRIR